MERRRSWRRRVALWGSLAFGVAVIVVLLRRPGSGPDYRIDQPVYRVSDAEFARSLAGVIGTAPAEGNRITPLQNGDEIFPSMLEAIGSARTSVNFETYIYWSGQIAERFAEALSDRARAGVDVNVIIDAIGGARMSDELITSMEGAGVDVRFFNPPRLLEAKSIANANNRTHRKLLIVDGRIGFVGGVGIADCWLGDARNPEEWREVHFRIEGPAVHHVQSAFAENWITCAGELLIGDEFYPDLEPVGEMLSVMVRSSPGGESGHIQTMYMLAIAAARSSILLATPYFVPDEHAVRELLEARRRGVEIDIIVPGEHSDVEIVRRASRECWGQLLEAGIRIYEFQPTMFHCKYLVVDEAWVCVGSANFDNRSFKLNDEANLVVLDESFGAELAATFDDDRSRSRRVTHGEWSQRPLRHRVVDTIAALFRQYL